MNFLKIIIINNKLLILIKILLFKLIKKFNKIFEANKMNYLNYLKLILKKIFF